MTTYTVPEIYLNTAQQERVCLLSDVNKILVDRIQNWKLHSSSLPDLNLISTKQLSNFDISNGKRTEDLVDCSYKQINLPSPAVSEKCNSWSCGAKNDIGHSRLKSFLKCRRRSGCSGFSNGSLHSISHVSTCASSSMLTGGNFLAMRDLLIWEFEDKISGVLRRTYSNPEMCHYSDKELYIKSKDSLSCSDIQQHKSKVNDESEHENFNAQNLLNPVSFSSNADVRYKNGEENSSNLFESIEAWSKSNTELESKGRIQDWLETL